MNLDKDCTAITKINSIWITDLKVESKIINHLDVNLQENLDDLRYGDEILDMSKARSMKEIIAKLNFIKIKNFCEKQQEN